MRRIFWGMGLSGALLLVSALFASGGWVMAAIPLETTPVWTSIDDNYSTGGFWGDIDGDGWLDLAVGNGNDMDFDPDNVFFNQEGMLELVPSWISSDLNCGAHIHLGDIDKDGLLDFAIGNLGYYSYNFPPLAEEVYFNQGTTLELLPSWQTDDLNNTFGIALGDPNGDGYLDFAAANGMGYTSTPQANDIYFNVGGVLETSASWLSDEIDNSMDVAWGDIDNDGDLDLAVGNELTVDRVYYNDAGALETSASWNSTYDDDAISIAWGDVDGDGYLDLAAANNDQLGGSGHFTLYHNDEGVLSSMPIWYSQWTGYASWVSFADVDDDGDLDLAAGGWWEPCRLYENIDGTLTTYPAWTSSTSSVIEAMVWGDVDNDGLVTVHEETTQADGTGKVFYLDHWPFHELASVMVSGSILPITDYCSDPSSGWVSLSAPPPPGQSVSFTYIYSEDLDLAVTNWDSYVGNYLFLNSPDYPDVTVRFTAYEASVPRGGELDYWAEVTNRTAQPQSFWGAAYLTLPNGNPYPGNPIVGPVQISLAPYESRGVHLVHAVPQTTPLGSFAYTVKVGHPPNTLIDQDTFTFTVLP